VVLVRISCLKTKSHRAFTKKRKRNLVSFTLSTSQSKTLRHGCEIWIAYVDCTCLCFTSSSTRHGNEINVHQTLQFNYRKQRIVKRFGTLTYAAAAAAAAAAAWRKSRSEVEEVI